MPIKLIILFVFLSGIFGAKAQLSFFFVAEVNGRNVDGLGRFQIQNLTGNTVSGSVKIKIFNKINGKQVVTIRTPEHIVKPGIHMLDPTVFTKSSFLFADNNLARIVNQTRALLPGEYSYCFEFVPSEKAILDGIENCFEGEIQPVAPLALISPEDKEVLCIKRPQFSWQPPFPMLPNMKFRLLLAERKQGDAVENLLLNSPLLYLHDITSNTIIFPGSHPNLIEGKIYCWQVIAYVSDIIISKSEVWTFEIKCKENPQVTNDSYRDLKSLLNANIYIANDYLKFSFFNAYNLKAFYYEILDPLHNMTPIKDIPKVTLKAGLNLIDIDLTELDLNEGNYYILKVYPFNEEIIELKFQYKTYRSEQ